MTRWDSEERFRHRYLLSFLWIIISTLGIHTAEAQTWARTYNSTAAPSGAKTIRQTGDGGFFFFDVAEETYRFAKLDAMGSVDWSATYVGEENPWPNVGNALQTSDGGYLLSGTIIRRNEGCPSRNVGLIKVDESGDIQWQRSYGFEAFWHGGFCRDNSEEGRAVAEAGDGGYLVLGYRYGSPDDPNLPPGQASQDGDLWLIKVDADGNLVWQKSYGAAGAETTSLNNLAVLDGGDIVIAGTTRSYGSAGREYALVMRLDSSGTIQWERALGSELDGIAPQSLVAVEDGVLVVAGTTLFDPAPGNVMNIWLVKLTGSGTVDWQRVTYMSPPQPLYPMRAQASADGGFVIYGSVGVGAGWADPLLAKLTSAGVLEWSMAYQLSASHDHAESGDETGDGGFILGGYSPFNNDVLLLRTDEFGVIDADYCNIAEAPPLQSTATAESLILTSLTTTVTTAPQWNGSLIRMTGTEVVDDFCSPPPIPNIHVDSNPLDFGDVVLGSASTRTLTVQNIGTADLVISGVTPPSEPEITLDSDGCSGFVLPAGVSCPLELTFTPVVEGPVSDQLFIASSDPDTPVLAVVLEGTGVMSNEIFAEGFESGDTSAWSATFP